MDVLKLRAYQPNGEYLEFIVGEDSTEGRIISIKGNQEDKSGATYFMIHYGSGVKVIVEGFPFTYQLK